MRISDLYEDIKTGISLEWVQTNCTTAIENLKRDKLLFRGMRIRDDIVLMAPSNRKSAFTQLNYYTEIINNGMNGFDGFPRREIIMSTNISYANSYGTLHLALPVDGAKLGICPTKDIWASFPDISNIDDFHERIVGMFVYNNFIKSADEINTLSKLKAQLEKAKKENFKFPTEHKYPYLNELNDTYDYRTITDLYRSDYFKLATLKEFGNIELENNEVWTDSPTVMIAMPTGRYEHIVELLTK